jgi:hypothetical protein
MMNKCPGNYELFTQRHNRLVKVVNDAIHKNIGEEIQGGVKENTIVDINELSEEVRRQRPDLVFLRKYRGEETVEIVEFTCPYGYRSKGRDTLEKAFEDKKEKYSQLAREIEEKTRFKAHIIPGVVSSMGAIYEESIKMLEKLLKCEKKKMRKLGKKMSEQVIAGSFKVWREYIASIKDKEEGEDQSKGEEDERKVKEAEIEFGQMADDEADGEEESEHESENREPEEDGTDEMGIEAAIHSE